MADLINRQKAIETAMTMYERCTTGDIADLRDLICESLAVLPAADTDMSEYSDRLWRSAYERGKAVGKAEGVIRCKDCAYRNGFASNVCPMLKAHKVRLRDDDYCSYAERKITHGKK